jgi:hypothetical protein
LLIQLVLNIRFAFSRTSMVSNKLFMHDMHVLDLLFMHMVCFVYC